MPQDTILDLFCFFLHFTAPISNLSPNDKKAKGGKKKKQLFANLLTSLLG